MLIPLERLLIRTRQVRSRADELIELRERMRAERKPSREERVLAGEVRVRKARVADALAHVASCGRCAAGKPLPRGAFAGGDCCSSVTAELFSVDEVGALIAGGTRARDLRAPRGEHAGCAFRGPTGCTLAAVDRPERCVTYACGTLKRELLARGELAHVEALVADLRAHMVQFLALRHARLDDELLGAS